MRILLFSHESDIDGLGNVVLAKKAFGDIDYILSPSVFSLEKTFREHLESGSFEAYDRIYITDLALGNPSLKMVANDVKLSGKVHVFDHHIVSINEGLGGYDFTTIIDEDENGKRCGTDLFYEYLVNAGFLQKSETLDDFVDLTRLEDTWLWKKSGDRGKKAHDMATFLNAVGIDEYIASMLKKVSIPNGKIEFSQREAEQIEQEKLEYQMKMQKFWESAEIFKDENGNLYAILYADYKYRNEITEYVRALDDNKNIKYIIMVALDKGLAGQKSYRSIAKDFDVNEIAEAHGGGGHKEAAAVNITPEQKDKVLTLEKIAGLEYLAKSSYKI